ncbi:hypothetical protein ABT282_31000 [Streptomyces sp. NPDC000927]|uniref:hypothetical protein n=1 Tax=Streptomyces sp. NPDC000927 TaxID=3154371 RepID=UPI003326975C
MKPETEKKVARLVTLRAEAKRLGDEAKALAWEILDTDERGTQKAVAEAWGVKPQAVGQWVRPESAKAA